MHSTVRLEIWRALAIIRAQVGPSPPPFKIWGRGEGGGIISWQVFPLGKSCLCYTCEGGDIGKGRRCRCKQMEYVCKPPPLCKSHQWLLGCMYVQLDLQVCYHI